MGGPADSGMADKPKMKFYPPFKQQVGAQLIGAGVSAGVYVGLAEAVHEARISHAETPSESTETDDITETIDNSISSNFSPLEFG